MSMTRSLAVEELPDSDDVDLQDWFHEQRLTDGLPIIVPTVERVDRFIEASGIDPTRVVGPVEPMTGLATVENVAVNAVMAGCKPQHLGVVLGAVDALIKPRFNLRGVQTTTNPVAPLVLVNGPIRNELDIASGGHALSGSSHANGPIGRAVRLVLRNIGGGSEDVSQTTLALPARYTFCLAEFEEESPWEPLHVSLGYQAKDNVVTVVGVESIVDVVLHMFKKSDSMIGHVVHTMQSVGSNALMGQGTALLILSPTHARILATEGWTRRSLQEKFFEDTKFDPDDWPFAHAEAGDISGGPQAAHGWVAEESKVRIAESPDEILIVVGGRDDHIHSTYMTPMCFSDYTSAKVW